MARSRAAAQDTWAGRAAADVSAQGTSCCCLKLPGDTYTKLEPRSSQRERVKGQETADISWNMGNVNSI